MRLALLFRPAVAVLATLTLGAPARAQSADERRAAALFREGRALVEKGDHAAGCAKFVESLAIVQSVGPAVNLAQCDERRGDLVSALKHWRIGISLLSPGDDRVAPARERELALDRRIPRIQLTLDTSVPREAVVMVDGVAVPFEVAGAPRPLNPGAHTVAVSAPGYVSFSTQVTLVEGQQARVPVSMLRVNAPAPQAQGSGGLRTAGFAIGGAGVASLVVGAVTGGLAIAKKGEVDRNCEGGCNDASRDAAQAGKAFATVSTATFIVGGAAAAAGVIMVVLGRPKAAVTGAVAPMPGGAALHLGGSF